VTDSSQHVTVSRVQSPPLGSPEIQCVCGETFRSCAEWDAHQARRFTIAIAPFTPDELQQVIDDIRARFGRKPLIHVIGDQPSGTVVDDTHTKKEANDERQIRCAR
jgi:hypothetical protein